MQKKILMIVQSTYPNDSRVRREAEALAEDNFEISIICLKKKSQEKFEIIKNKIFVYRIESEEDDESLFKYVFFSIKFLMSSTLYSIKLSKNTKFDLLQIHNLPDYLVFSAIFFKIKKIPIVLDLHDLTPELFKSKLQGNHKLIFNLTKIIEKLSCKFANHLITTSLGFKEQLVSRGIPQEKITIILNNPSKFIVREKQLDFRKIDKNLKIIYHGTLAHRFGLHCVIEAMPLILEKLPGSIFHMYGGGDTTYINELNNLIKKKKLQENVKIYDSLIHEEIIKIIQEYDIGVVPYLVDEFMQLALSTKSFEYAKLYIPMVASALKPIMNYFDNNSIIFFEPGNVGDLANKIIYLASTTNLMKNVSINSYKRVQTIINSNVEKNYVNLINRLTTYIA